MRTKALMVIVLIIIFGLATSSYTVSHVARTYAVALATPLADEPREISFKGITDHEIAGLYFPAPKVPAPAVILLGFKEAWTKWARLWRDRGFNVIAIDLRTYGPQGISPEIAANDIQDILLVIQQLHDIPAVMPDQIALAGGSIIGSYALVACAKSPDCRTVILLSATNYKGDLADPIETFGKRPLFIAVSDGEGSITETDRAYAAQAQGKHQLIVYEGTAHATGLLTSQPELADKIGDWLVKYLANTDATHGATVEF